MSTINITIIVKNRTKMPIALTNDPDWDDQQTWINHKLNKLYLLNPNDQTTILCPGVDPSYLDNSNLFGFIFSSDPNANTDFLQFQMGCTDKKVFGITDDITTAGNPKFKITSTSTDKVSCTLELS